MEKSETVQLSTVTDAGMLLDAAELVRQGWTREYAARDKNGYPVSPVGPNAACFCTIGAINRAVLKGLGGDLDVAYTDLYEETCKRLHGVVYDALSQIFPPWISSRSHLTPYRALGDWNDQSGDRNTVVAVLRKAATLAAAPADTTKDEGN